MSFVFDMNRDPADYHQNEGLDEGYVFYKMKRRHLNYMILGEHLSAGGKVVVIYKAFAAKVCYKEDLMSYNYTDIVLRSKGAFNTKDSPSNYILFKAI